MNQNLPAKKPVDVLKNIVNSDSIKKRLKDALDDQAGIFSMSVIDVYSSSKDLQKCNPAAVMAEAMKAAALKLPITKSLGFAYILPFKGEPVFTMGYKGMIQLAMRTGQFKILNADAVYEGEVVETDRLTGSIKITGKAKNDKAIGYFAHMELVNGFVKTIYWEHERVMAHAKKYSKSFAYKSSTWVTNTESMCIKTVVRQLLSKWAPMSIDFIGADGDDEKQPEPKDITPPEDSKPAKTTKTSKKKKGEKPETEVVDVEDISKTETTGTQEKEPSNPVQGDLPAEFDD